MLSGSDIVRKAGATSVYNLTEGKYELVVVDGKVTGIATSGKGVWALAAGGAAVLNGKPFTYTSHPHRSRIIRDRRTVPNIDDLFTPLGLRKCETVGVVGQSEIAGKFTLPAHDPASRRKPQIVQIAGPRWFPDGGTLEPPNRRLRPRLARTAAAGDVVGTKGLGLLRGGLTTKIRTLVEANREARTICSTALAKAKFFLAASPMPVDAHGGAI